MIQKRLFIYLIIGILSLANLGSIPPPVNPTKPIKYNATDLARIMDQVQTGEVRPDEVVVRLLPNMEIDSVEKCAGITPSTTHQTSQIENKIQVIQLKSIPLSIALQTIQDCPGVLYVEPNFKIHSTENIPNDPYFENKQFGLQNINAPKGWDYSIGSSLVTIAILDSGVDLTHPDLAEKIVPGYDFVNKDSIPQDDFGHGTHVAGIAAAVTNNNFGVAGVSWEARIMPLKVLDSTGSGYSSDSAQAIIWAADHGAKVINMSFGTISPSSAMLDAINYAYSMGVTMVAASGNEGINGILFPAKYNHVIAVGATDITNNRGSFSNYGSELDLVAPGVNIYSTIMSGGIGLKTGTSMATPFVSGLAALLAGLSGDSSPDEIELAMINSALDLGATGKDIYYGNGLIQVDGSLIQFLPPLSFSKTNPINSSINESTDRLYSWGISSFASSYEFCIDTNDNGTCDNSWLSTNLDLSKQVSLLSNTTYFWQVRAVNSNGVTYSDSNLWWKLTTKNCSILSSSIYPIGGGVIGLEPQPDCQNGSKYSDGTQVSLNASPTSSKFRFNNWSGDLNGNENSQMIYMNSDQSVTANFEKAIFDDVPFDYSQTLGGVIYNLHPYIQAIWDNGFTNGIWVEKDTGGNITNALYGPENYLNRGMVAKFLLNVVHGRDYGVPTLPTSPRFILDNWSNPDINWAWPWAEELLVEGLTNGCYQDPITTERAYCPTNISSRVEAAKFGLTMKHGSSYLPPEGTGTVFADMLLPILETDPPAHWGIAWAEQSYLEGLLPGCGTDIRSGKPLFCPDDPINRAWSAYLIVKSKDLAIP